MPDSRNSQLKTVRIVTLSKKGKKQPRDRNAPFNVTVSYLPPNADYKERMRRAARIIFPDSLLDAIVAEAEAELERETPSNE